MANKKLWKGIEELNNDPAFTAHAEKEFREELPIEILAAPALSGKQAGRRDFLKMLGFGVGAATIAACRIPVTKVIPYVVKPEEITPGVANYYASTFVDGSDYCSVLVKVRDGRPIKIEGNDNSHVTMGVTNARAQASVLSMYDKTRGQHASKGGSEAKWETVDAEIRQALQQADAKKGNIRVLSSSIYSPTTRQLIQDLGKTYKNAGFSHVTYDSISRSAMLTANEKMFGKRMIPSYRFSDAKVIVGFACDFLGTWISPIEFASDYAQGRRANKDMSRHYHFESTLSLTGSNADRRYTVKQSLLGSALVALYNKISGESLPAGTLSDKVMQGIDKVAMDLTRPEMKGKTLVVCGINDENCQLICNAINDKLGNYGSTINYTQSSLANQGVDADMEQLVSDMNGGTVDALIVLNANPSYDYYDSKKFNDGLKKVGLTVSCNDRMDETSSNCTYHCPDHHYLESWNDAEPKTGMYSLSQPTISPLFKTRQAQDSLLMWMGSSDDYYTYLRNYWEKNMFPLQSSKMIFRDFWDHSVRYGVFEANAGDGKTDNKDSKSDSKATGKWSLSSAASDLAGKETKGMELVVYESIAAANGRYANNPWLQELPDPISKVTWDNYASINPETAKTMGLVDGDYVKVTAGGYSVEVPMVSQPGQNKDTVAIALGYGRTKAGRAGDNVGANTFPFVTVSNGNYTYMAADAKVAATGNKEKLAQTQTHHTIEGRDIALEWTMEEFLTKGDAAAAGRDKLEEEIVEDNLYPKHPYTGLRWYMSIDLNSCIGCGACVIGCQSENNVPVVGKNEVARVHEMAWMRIDRYYSFSGKNGEPVTKETHSSATMMANEYSNVGDWEDVEVLYQPMLCQHCENAPCENVCPVAATNHSSEGINQMIYNRCIGTRYCANNCPYKVRRFNWFDYTTADSFPWNTHDDAKMTDEITRMVLNPDVTVRSRGVMEKCSFCVQRIQDGKLRAKREGRELGGNEVKSACQTACPTRAITFGNQNDKTSEVSKLKADNRTFYVLQELHTQPSVGYMAKVRNIETEKKA